LVSENGSSEGDSFESVPQLYRLLAVGMKVSEFVGLGPLGVAIGPKSFENLMNGDQKGGQRGCSSQNWTLANSSISNDRNLKILP
jgi:hypothetical protein